MLLKRLILRHQTALLHVDVKIAASSSNVVVQHWWPIKLISHTNPVVSVGQTSSIHAAAKQFQNPKPNRQGPLMTSIPEVPRAMGKEKMKGLELLKRPRAHLKTKIERAAITMGIPLPERGLVNPQWMHKKWFQI